MSSGASRGRSGSVCGSKIGGVEVTDDDEGQHDEQHHDAGEQHEQAEDAAQVAMEGDVPEAQGAHHRERPVEARQPGVLLALLEHQDMEDRRVGDHDEAEQKQVAEEAPQVAARPALGEEGGELRRNEFHLCLPGAGA